MLRSVLCRGLFENWGRCYCGDVLFGVSQIGPCFAVQGCLLREHKQCLLGLCRGCSGGVSAAQHAARCGSPIAEAGRGKTRLTHSITFPNCVPQISPLVLLGLYCFHHTIWVQLRRGGAAGAPAGLQVLAQGWLSHGAAWHRQQRQTDVPPHCLQLHEGDAWF